MIIGITGKIGSGKDTAGLIIRWLTSEYLRELWDYNMYTYLQYAYQYPDQETKFEIVKYADILKEITCMLIGCTREQIEDRKFKETPLNEKWWCYELSKKYIVPRWSFGNDVDNEIAEKRYLRKLTPRLMLQLLGTEGGREVIHPDIWVNATMNKYKPNESNWVITDVRFPNEAEAIYDKGGFMIQLKRPETDGEAGGHASETALDKWTFEHVIVNDGTINELKDSLYALLLAKGVI